MSAILLNDETINHVFRDILLCLKLYIEKGRHSYIAIDNTIDYVNVAVEMN